MVCLSVGWTIYSLQGVETAIFIKEPLVNLETKIERIRLSADKQ